MARCPMCSGPGLLLGVLGCLKWFTCRDCGWEFNRKVTIRCNKPKKKEGEK